MKSLRSHWFAIVLMLISFGVIAKKTFSSETDPSFQENSSYNQFTNEWQPPDINDLNESEAKLVLYGRELIVHTSKYFGPKGKIETITNGMNCQNCHLEGGTKNFSNCLSAVASTYPVYRDRSGKLESVEYRVNECMERSLNGQRIQNTSNEMKAMVAYLKWLGKDVPKDVKPTGAGTIELSFLPVAASPEKGKLVYTTRCEGCHGKNGEGMLNIDSSAYLYPPLWGDHSYNVSAGLYRLSKFAAFVKTSMPYGTAATDPLSDEDAWNVAAFVNSQPRPQKLFTYDWPNIEKKPVDYPFPPYSDKFSTKQHKFGPFTPIVDERKKHLK